MKVYVDAPRTMSQAMLRVSNALKKHAPKYIECVRRRDLADLQVMHVIGTDAVPYAQDWGSPTEFNPGRQYAVLQYCVATGGSYDAWRPLWDRAKLVWSYYDLDQYIEHFYHAPLGVDGKVFDFNGEDGTTGVFTSGYVSGRPAEAIYEITVAADRVGLPVVHLGPTPLMAPEQTEKMRTPKQWRSIVGVNDLQLAQEYAQSLWVSGLRYVEGFELPCVEGLACGARPIVFDRPDMRQWYEGHAVFVKEGHGSELAGRLMDVLMKRPEPVTREERQQVLETFSWEKFAKGFWSRLEDAL